MWQLYCFCVLMREVGNGLSVKETERERLLECFLILLVWVCKWRDRKIEREFE